MKIDILSLFPFMFDNFLNTSIIKRAIEKKKVEINVINFRDYSKDPHKKVDDTPFGGGSGMVLTCQPIFDCVESIRTDDSYVILLTPTGVTYNQKLAKELTNFKHLIIICGHYEGIDQRILDIFDAKEISIGDYVLTGGEIPAMALVDAVSRYVGGVLSEGSTVEESFSNGLLEYPQYTKPQDFMGHKVPEVLTNGNHKLINEWRKNQSLEITKTRRPDLYKVYKEKNK